MRMVSCTTGQPLTPMVVRMLLWQWLLRSPPYQHARICIERQLMRQLASAGDFEGALPHDWQAHADAPPVSKTAAELHRLR